MATLDLYIDFKSPASYLALKPTLNLIETLQPTVRWWPFRSSQRSIPAEKATETRGETHIRVRESARRDVHLKYAALQHTAMTFRPTPGNTDLALAALLYTQAQPVKFIQAAYHAYWVEQADLNDATVVESLLSAAGYDADGFDAEQYLARLADALTEAEEHGIVDAPGYLIDEQVFIGREHMPWIRSLLGSG